MAIYTVIWEKAGSTFADGNAAYADMFSGAPSAFTSALSTVDNNLISSGVVNTAETYAWDQASSRLTITRDISDMDAFLNARADIRTSYMSIANDNGWSRIKAVND